MTYFCVFCCGVVAGIIAHELKRMNEEVNQ